MSMEEWTGFEISDKVLNEASAWIAKLDHLGESPCMRDHNTDSARKASYTQTMQAFNEWLSAHPHHHQAYAEMSLVWAKTACIDQWHGNLEKHNILHFPVTQGSAYIDAVPDINSNLENDQLISDAASPSWAYSVALTLISLGLLLPALQTLF